MTKQRLLEIKSAVVDNYGRMMEKAKEIEGVIVVLCFRMFQCLVW